MQARALATRARILDQASVAFARIGYDSASLTGDILEPAAISVGSFYHQFDNKLDVLFALLRERQPTLADDLDVIKTSSGSLDLLGRVTTLLNVMLDRVDAEPDLYLIQLRERWHPDETVRSAVGTGWSPWFRCFDCVVAGTDGAARSKATAARLLGAVVLPTLGAYLELAPADRPAWRAGELPHVAAFCSSGIRSLTDA